MDFWIFLFTYLFKESRNNKKDLSLLIKKETEIRYVSMSNNIISKNIILLMSQ